MPDLSTLTRGNIAGKPASARRYPCAGKSPLSWWKYARDSPGQPEDSWSVYTARWHNCGGFYEE